MASLWNQLAALFGSGSGASSSAPGAGMYAQPMNAADPGASVYGQPIQTADLPPAQPAAGPGAQVTPAYSDPSTLRLPGLGAPRSLAALPQLQAAPAVPDAASPAPAQAAPASQAMIAPPTAASSLPQMSPAMAPPPVKTVHSVWGNILDALSQGAISRSDQQKLDQARSLYEYQRAQQFAKTLPDDAARNAFWANPAKFVEAWDENMKPQKYAPGETAVLRGDTRAPFYAPQTVTDNGRVLSVTPNGARPLGDTGPTFNAEGLDTRGLSPQANFNKAVPLESALFTSGGTFVPGGQTVAAGLPQLSAAGGSDPAAPGPGVPGLAPEPGQTRGERNNNPGNVRALPNGQKWQGQTGVDDKGYAVFGASHDGIRAALTNLHSYGQRDGVNTAQGVADRWAPKADGNDPQAYGAFIAQRLGIKPTDRIDLNDADTLRNTAQAIFDFEGGRGGSAPAPAPVAPPPRSLAALPQKGQAATGEATIKANAVVRQLSPQEVQARGFAPGTVAFQRPNGDVDVKSGGTAWTPKDVQEIRKGAMETPEYREAKASILAYKALTANTGQMTGPNAYNILDTWIRTINPGATAKQGNIEAVMAELGVPAEVIGIVQHLKGQGKLPQDIQQKIVDGVLPFVQGHWDQANSLNQANAEAVSRHGYDPRDAYAPLESRPERYTIPGQGAGGGGAPVRLEPKTADADYARLPSGAAFIGPDGKQRVKP